MFDSYGPENRICPTCSREQKERLHRRPVDLEPIVPDRHRRGKTEFRHME